jgi:hypothetical protein
VLTGCTGYDFGRARRPDGSYDLEKLKADLQASGRVSMSDGSWIPLIHFESTSFGPSSSDAPSGYTLSKMSAYGPLFFVGSRDEQFFAEDGAHLEDRAIDWVGWGTLWFDREERVETKRGERISSDWRLGLLIGQQGVRYTNAAAPPSR